MYFKSWIDKLNMTTYSLDMVRYNIEFSSIDDTNEFVGYIKTLDVYYGENYLIKYTPSFKQFQYRHLWSIETVNHNSWAIGLDLTGKPEDKVKGFIEFNPNKCMNDIYFEEFWSKLHSSLLTVSLVRYDVAIDIPLPRSQCKIIKQGRKVYHLIEQDDGVTEYLGVRSHNGFVKLYDKTKESKLKTDITRLEITLDFKTDLSDVFPTVFIYDTQQMLVFNDNLNQTDKTLITLIRNSEMPSMYLKMLGRYERKKIEPYCADRVLQLNNKCFQSVKLLATSYCK